MGELDDINFSKILKFLRPLGIGLIIVILLPMVTKVVPAGTVGVQDTMGSVDEKELPQGFHLKNPMTRIEEMSIKTQEIKEAATVPSKEGLSVTLDVSLLFKLKPANASDIYQQVGTNYPEIIIKPQFRSIIREVTAEYETKALYTSGREIVANKIFEKLKPELEKRGVILESVLLRDLSLPEKVTQAIESKLQAEQEIEKQRFLVDKEKEEKERKIVEAEGIAKANEIISNSLTPSYLQWYAIQSLNPSVSVTYLPAELGTLPLVKEIE